MRRWIDTSLPILFLSALLPACQTDEPGEDDDTGTSDTGDTTTGDTGETDTGETGGEELLFFPGATKGGPSRPRPTAPAWRWSTLGAAS
ncbi:hypothetical protein [Pseudenhygromyxa sp. WMMC2535]|uniref:hypothetical protein n=1 Tax=Pseudenhygromyxa sp. WMMC2535 TaxID=2712867 RepID=UPI001C3E00B1|nr:hypothetical protein [Pseudenhygromyxa sp. WMMC2535]